jgi:hypothetical protein
VVSAVTGETGDEPADDPTADDPTADDPTADDPTADDPTADDPTDDPGAAVGTRGVFGTGTTVVETGMLVVLRLVEFSEETVLTELVNMVEVVKL